ncbi:MAG: putative effector of murein hydrolase transrane protein [Frankiales bacterium]|nr:putative effector of murein hydrolase transrane protein [Frankiales bacterium]
MSTALALAGTLAAYRLALASAARLGRPALLNPVLLSVVLVGAVLLLTGTDYDAYFAAAQPLHVLLGPATVALAVPLHRQRARVRAAALPLLAGLLVGVVSAVGTALLVPRLLGAPEVLVLSLAPKSATTPVAIALSADAGGAPALTAALVILTGIGAAVAGPALLDLLGVRDPAARGFALGVTGHGIATARALQEGEQQGAFAGLGIGLGALGTSVVLPLLLLLHG